MTTPNPWHRLERETIAALLASDGRARRRLEQALRASERRLSSELTSGGAPRSLGGALHLVRDETAALVRELDHAILDSRVGSKRVSAERLRAEWARVQAEVKALGYAPPGDLNISSEIAKPDRIAARVASLSLADAWRNSLNAGLSRARETPGAFQAVAMASSARVEYRFRRTASTENTRAFADVRMLAMRDAARRYRKTPWFSFLGKRWDATLDAYVCNVCGVLDGEVVPWHEPFPNDAIPGYLHPSCRCAMTTIFSPGGLKREARRRPASAQRPPGPTKATQ